MQIDHRREFFKAIIRALAHRYDDQIIFSNNNSIKKFKIMATSTKLWLYDKSTKTKLIELIETTSRVPIINFADPVLAITRCASLFLSWYSREWGLHCFAVAYGIINFELIAADSQRRVQCILVKNGPLTQALTIYLNMLAFSHQYDFNCKFPCCA